MANCADIFLAFLDEKEVGYDKNVAPDGTIYVGLPFNDIKITVIFDADDDGTRVAFRSRFDTCPADRIPDMLVTCNELNKTYRWVKFCIDDDNDIMIEDDAIVTPETVGPECFELVLRTVSIVRDVKPKIMRVLYA